MKKIQKKFKLSGLLTNLHWRLVLLSGALLLVLVGIFVGTGARDKRATSSVAQDSHIQDVSSKKTSSAPATVPPVVEQPAAKDSVTPSQTQSSTSQQQAAPASRPERLVSPPPVPFRVASFNNLNQSLDCRNDTTTVSPYNMSVSLQTPNAGGIIQWRWEYSGDVGDMSGRDVSAHSDSVASELYVFFFGGNLPPGYNYMIGTTAGYQYRIHVLAPNDIASNWMSVPATNCPEF